MPDLYPEQDSYGLYCTSCGTYMGESMFPQRPWAECLCEKCEGGDDD